MDLGGIDQLRVVPDADGGPGQPAGRRVFLIAGLVAVVAITLVVAWSRAQPDERACTLAPVSDAPTGANPTAALDSWWATGGAERVGEWSSFGHVAPAGSVPARGELTQLGDTTWEWRYLDKVSVGIEVSSVAGGTGGSWAVVGIGQCAYGPFDTRGGA